MKQATIWFLPAFMMASLVVVPLAAGQVEMDEEGVIVAEEMLVEEAVSGGLTEEAMPETESLPEETLQAEEAGALEDLLGLPLEDEALPETDMDDTNVVEDVPLDEGIEEAVLAEEPPADEPAIEEAPVEVLAEEGVEAELDEEPLDVLEAEPVEEPLEEILMAEEPPAEEPAIEESPVEVLAEESVEAELDEAPLDVLEAEPVEEPLEEILMAEEPPADEPAIEEAPVEMLAEEGVEAELAEEPLAEAATVVEEPLAEEMTVEALAEELLQGEMAEEVIEEEIASEEPFAEEPMAEEFPVEEEAIEAVAADIPVEAAPVERVTEAPVALEPEAAWGAEPEAAVAAEMPVPEVEDVSDPEAVTEAEPSQPVDPRLAEVRMMEVQESLKRRAYLQHARERMTAARKAYQGGDYRAAREMYREAKQYYGDHPEVQDEVAMAENGIRNSMYRLALELRDQQLWDEAEKVAGGAAQLGHPKGPELLEAIQAARRAEPPPPEAPATRWTDPEYKKVQRDVEQRLRIGRQYLATEELEKAEIMFESVLKIAPENSDAMRLLQKVAQRKYDKATKELEATRRNMIANLRDTWNPRTYRSGLEGEDEFWVPEKTQQRRDEEDGPLQIIKKMENIIVPEIEFRQANINDVVSFLQSASVEFDESVKEDSQQARKGVNLILNLGPGPEGAAEAEAASVDIFAEPAAQAGAAEAGVPLITFSARYISLLEALKIVTEVANLKYQVEGQVVMIVPKTRAVGKIIHRMYDVLPSVNEKIPQLVGGGAGAAGGGFAGGGEFQPLESAGLGLERTEWKEFFGSMGVPWPDGSSIKYIPSIGKIVVANTADNLAIFEKILAVLNVVPSQIEIEARFVEVSQDDLDSLGMEWMLTDDWEVAQKGGQRNVPFGSRERIMVGANANNGGFTVGNRYLTDGIGVGDTVQPIVDNVLSVASVLTNPEMKFVLHAMSQRGNTDLLSAPKVTTKSGQEATIKVVTEFIYPTEFTVSGISGSTSDVGDNAGTVGAVVEPGGFETREVGVILVVLPEVSSEGQMIDLALTPEVVDFLRFEEYGSTYTDSQGQTQQLRMPQPIFHSRSVQTSISIYNGATVVMGGMINEGRVDVDDKIPILGDIPVLGRLFRSRYEQSEKRNLLIFVTARLVDPAGRAIVGGQQEAATALMGEAAAALEANE